MTGSWNVRRRPWPLSECTLCTAQAAPFAEVRGRSYWHCAACDLVFLDPVQRPSRAEEEAEYRLHQNNIGEPGYRKHLQRLTLPLFECVSKSARALDFGSGPTASISALMAPSGYEVRNYDPVFADDPPQGTYDIISSSEAAEHFFSPGATFDWLNRLLAAGGRLGVMTELRQPNQPFESWYYVAPVSHVSFYSPMTMDWLGQRFGWELITRGPRVNIFRKHR